MLDDVKLRLRSLFHRRQVEDELEDELRFHREREAEKYVAAGVGRDEAMRRARLAFGGVDAVKEECREARGLSWIETLWQDTRYAARMFRKSPGFSAIAILTLALGIGANTAIFSVLEGVLLKPLSYPQAEQLVGVEISPMAIDPTVRGMAPEDYFIFREQSRSLQEIGIYSQTGTDHDMNVTGFAEPERVHALHATASVLSVLAVPPAIGRVFAAADDVPSAAPTVVLTDAYWRRKFGGDPGAIGKTLVVDGVAREIIGVMPRQFRFVDLQDLALIVPLQLDRNQARLGNFSYAGIARLKQGVTIDEARADLARLVPATITLFPPAPGASVELFRNARLTPSLLPLKQEVIGAVGTLLWVLMAGVGMVLLIACANVANLLLVRTTGRRRELSLRAALGASRRRIAAQLLRESAFLGLLGGMLGLALSWAGLRLIVRLAPAGLPRVDEIGIDLPVLLFALVAALLTSLLFGLIPVLNTTMISEAIPSSGRTFTAGRERHRVQGALVAVQVALALVLMICSGLMIRTFVTLTHVDPGYAPGDVQTFRVSVAPTDVADDAAVPRLEQQIQDKLAAIPGVSSVAFGSAVPMDGNGALDNIMAADRSEEDQRRAPPLRHFVFISPGYLQTIRVPLVAGREMAWPEIYNQVPVALVSENFAREYWGSAAGALGKRIRPTWSTDWREVVGVVADLHDESIDTLPRATVYFPPMVSHYRGNRARVTRFVTFAVRSRLAGSELFLKQLRRAVWSLDPKLPLAGEQTLNFLYTRSMARTSFTLVMLGIAAAMALLLGTIGLYGVIAYSVSQRTREIGVRMALGAQQAGILALIVRRGMGIIGVGLAAGLVTALLATRLLASMLYGVRPQDPLTYAVVVLVLAAVALGACYVPARRATRIEPMIALRYE